MAFGRFRGQIIAGEGLPLPPTAGARRIRLDERARSTMSGAMNRITVNPEQCGGRPCIRGMRIRVTDVLDLLAAGLAQDEVLEELPDLEPEDIIAALQYASRQLDHPILAA
jgi:uncharacterized protein (DUF433 family)